jgi:hypothetical protein
MRIDNFKIPHIHILRESTHTDLNASKLNAMLQITIRTLVTVKQGFEQSLTHLTMLFKQPSHVASKIRMICE